MQAALTCDGCGVRFRDYGLFQAKSVEEEIRMTSAILGSVIGLAVFLQQGSAVGLLNDLCARFDYGWREPIWVMR